MLVSSRYKVASDEVNRQVDDINAVLKKYDKNGMLIGEAPCTKDLITVTDRDFKVVNIISIAAIFIIIALVLKSVTLPVILVAVIEFAIFINLGIPFYTGTAPALCRPHLHQYHPAGRHGGLCHSDDHPVQKGALPGPG